MRSFIFIIGAFLCSVTGFAQDKPCKFTKLKDASGQIKEGFIIPSKLGNFTMIADDAKIYMYYAPKLIVGLVFDETRNRIPLRIDSVKIYFDNATMISLKAIGSGKVINSSTQLKPMFETVSYSFVIDRKEHLQKFLDGKVKAFGVVAEKEAQWADGLNEKQQGQLLSAFICFTK